MLRASTGAVMSYEMAFLFAGTLLPAGDTDRGMRSAELVDIEAQAAAEVGSLVFRNDVLASETEKKSLHFRVCGLCLSLVGHLADATHGCAGCLGPIAVLDSSFLRLADSLERGFMICHLCFLFAFSWVKKIGSP